MGTNTSGKSGGNSSNGRGSVQGPDVLDVATMSEALASNIGGRVCYGFSPHPQLASATLITAYALVPVSEGTSQEYLWAVMGSVTYAGQASKSQTLPAKLYMMLWELETEVRKLLGDDVDW